MLNAVFHIEIGVFYFWFTVPHRLCRRRRDISILFVIASLVLVLYENSMTLLHCYTDRCKMIKIHFTAARFLLRTQTIGAAGRLFTVILLHAISSLRPRIRQAERQANHRRKCQRPWPLFPFCFHICLFFCLL